MTNNFIFKKSLALVLCLLMLAGTFTACMPTVEFDPPMGDVTVNGEATTKPSATQPNATEPNNDTTTGDSANNDPEEDPVDPNELYSGQTTLESDSLVYGTLANDVFIGDESVAAMIPADVKVEAGATALELSIKNVEEATAVDGEALSNLDVHISGIALDNTVPMTVMLGAILPIGLANTELKLYHVENGTPVLMTRVASAADFAIHNQYVYDAETGVVTIYVASFSVFTAVQTSASKWDENTVADTSWYNENDTEFTLEDVADFLGFRDLVDGGNKFEGKTVTLATDIDLDKKLFNPIGGGWAYNGGNTFNGTFDGDNHTIYNLRVNGWELDETGDKHSGTSMGAGLFSSLHNATVRNLAVVGSELIVETTSIGIIAGVAQGKCTFENIVVSNATLGNYQMRNGGIVGDIYVIASDNVPEDDYSHTFKNIVVDSSVKLSSMWGDFDTGNGGVIGGKYGSSKVLMQNVIVAAELDVFSDVTAAYQWYAYRRCGMLVGYTGQNSPKQATNAAADFLTCENVSVYYGNWTNYTYYQFNEQDNATGRRYPWVRAEASPYNNAFSNVRYGVPTFEGVKVSDMDADTLNAKKSDFAAITFNQLYGGGQGVYGTNEHAGVTVNYSLTKTIYIENNLGWENLNLYYWFANGDDTWTTLVDPITLTEENGVYRVDLPAYAFAFKITADGENETRDFYLSEVTENETYKLDFAHVHHFDNNNKCDCDVTQKFNEHEFTLGTDGEAKHSDGGNAVTTYEGNDFTLTLEGLSSVYGNARDEMGNSCIKLGTGSLTGGFSFTVPEDVVKVIIYVAGYKNNNATIEINGVQHEITTLSNNGEYTAIEIDTSEIKTVSLTTIEVKSESRCMINTISFATVEFINNHTCVFSEATCETKATCTICGATTGEFAKHSWNDATCTAPKTCSVCAETDGETLPHTDNNPADHICDICNAENVSEHNYTDGYCSICSAKEPADYSGEYYIAAIRSSGNYWYMTSDLGSANTKRYQAVDSGLTTLPLQITNSENNKIFVLEKNDDGTYIIYAKDVDGDKYLGWTSGNSGALVSKESAQAFTIIFNEENKTYTINFDSRYLSLNKTSGNNYFAFYEGTQQQDLALIPINNCEHNYNSVVTDPTCTTDGYTTYTCTECGNSYTGNTVAATGHVNTTTTTVDASCTVAGSVTVTCDDCGTTVSTETIKATGHNYVDGTCTGCGETEPTEPAHECEHKCATCNKCTDNDCKETACADKCKGHNESTTYTFSNYTAGTQYADDEKHVLDENVTITTYDCHFTSELRIYSSSTNNGYAIIKSANPITAIGVNAGNKVDKINIYGSNDGETWTTDPIATISVTSTSYKDYSLELGNEYKWLKLDVAGSNQVRLKSMTLTTVTSGSEDNGETEHTHSYTSEVTPPTCTEAGYTTYTCTCGYSYIDNEVAATGHTYENGTCIGCDEKDPDYNAGGSTEPAEPTTETLNIYGTTGTTGTKTISWTSGDVTFTNNQASSTTAIRTSDSDHFRIYAKSQVVITANGNITEVVITCTNSSYATAMKTSATNAGYTATVSDSVVTITVNNEESITFIASAQIRINKVVVTYTSN